MYNHFGHTMKNSFNEFLELLKKSNAVIFLPQHKYLHKKSNIIRLESIESDFNNFCEKHNIKSKLVTSNVSSKSLVKGLSKKQKELIHKRYKEDFDLLGYKK